MSAGDPFTHRPAARALLASWIGSCPISAHLQAQIESGLAQLLAVSAEAAVVVADDSPASRPLRLVSTHGRRPLACRRGRRP